MHSSRRRITATFAAVALTALLPALAQAQGKSLKILVGFPPGGAVDVVARQVGEELRQLGYNAIIENKTGASGRLATEQLLQSPADGGTVLLMPNGNVSIFQHVYPKLKYKLSDMVPLATVCSFDFGLAVGSGSTAKTLKEFIDGAKAKPGQAAYGTPGPGTAMHFMGAMLAKTAGFEFTHIPYRGGAAAMTDVIGGTVPALATTVPNLITPHKDGKLRTLAVSSEHRLKSMPDVPTFKESGFADLVISEHFGFFASAKMPEAVQAELEKALMAAASKPRVVAALEKLEFDSVVKGRADYLALMKSDLARWGPVVKASGYRAED